MNYIALGEFFGKEGLKEIKELRKENEIEGFFVCEEFGYAAVIISGKKFTFEDIYWVELFEILD